MSKWITAVIIGSIALLASESSASVIRLGNVKDNVPLQPNFNLTAYLGHWFEIYRSNSMPFESGTDNTATYVPNADGTVGVTNKEWLPNDQKCNIATAIGAVPDPSVPAQLTVQFGPFQPPGDYRVLATDYVEYAVVYSHYDAFGPFGKKYGWILGRTSTISAESIANAFKIFSDRVKMNESDFHKTEQGVAPVAC